MNKKVLEPSALLLNPFASINSEQMPAGGGSGPISEPIYTDNFDVSCKIFLFVRRTFLLKKINVLRSIINENE